VATVLTSPLLDAIPGIRQGFSTRKGGVSTGPLASLNLALEGDDPAALAENRARFAAALRLDGARLVEVRQVHGARVLDADALTPEQAAELEADGLFACAPGRALAVRTADCAPILLAAVGDDGRARAVAAVHAGWRGATSGIVAEALARFAALGHAPHRLFAAIGPTIGVEAFEVGDEVVEAARLALGGEAPPTQRGPSGRAHLDLPELVRRLLERGGIPSARIDLVGGCTCAQPERFFSHRRDRGVTGRQLSAIALAPAGLLR
jgi:YfiH family protein